jgi:hypothetical protein
MQSAGNRSFGELLDEQDENLENDKNQELQSLLGDEEKGDRDAFELTQTNQTETKAQSSTNPFDPILSNQTQGPRTDDPDDDFLVYLPQIVGKANKLSWGQMVFGEGLKFTFAAVPPYLLGQDEILGQYLSQVPDVYNDMLKMIMFPTNVVINQMIEALVYKENPLDGLRALGGNAAFGAVKKATTRAACIGMVALGGYGAHVLIQANMHQMLYSDDDNLRTLGLVLTEDAFKIPLFGLTGYLFEEILYRQIGMRLWECCSSSKEEKIKNQDLNLVQKTLDYAVQFFLTTSMTECMLYYINIFSQDPIGHDPRFQSFLWLMNNLTTLRVGRYLASEPDPCNAITPFTPKIEYSDDPDEIVVEASSKCASRGKTFMVLGMMAVGFYGGAYLFNRVTCGIADYYNSDICEVDSLENRLIRDAAMVAVPAAIEFAAKDLFPAIKTGVTKCWSSLFSSRNPGMTNCSPPSGQDFDATNAEELTRPSNTSLLKRSY